MVLVQWQEGELEEVEYFKAMGEGIAKARKQRRNTAPVLRSLPLRYLIQCGSSRRRRLRAQIVINRPSRRNAFTPRTVTEMSWCMADARMDTSIGVIVLTGVCACSLACCPNALGHSWLPSPSKPPAHVPSRSPITVPLPGQGDLAFCSGGDQAVRGEGGYVGSDGVPRLNVLDLQVGGFPPRRTRTDAGCLVIRSHHQERSRSRLTPAPVSPISTLARRSRSAACRSPSSPWWRGTQWVGATSSTWCAT